MPDLPRDVDGPAVDVGSGGAPEPGDPAALTVLEDDETVPPRPEEDAADTLRSRPDPH